MVLVLAGVSLKPMMVLHIRVSLLGSDPPGFVCRGRIQWSTHIYSCRLLGGGEVRISHRVYTAAKLRVMSGVGNQFKGPAAMTAAPWL